MGRQESDDDASWERRRSSRDGRPRSQAAPPSRPIGSSSRNPGGSDRSRRRSDAGGRGWDNDERGGPPRGGPPRGGPPSRRPSRAAYDDEDDRYGPRGGNRSARGARPPTRDDAGYSPRGRGMGSGAGGDPRGSSSGRGRPPARPSGLWEDEEPPRRVRPSGVDPRRVPRGARMDQRTWRYEDDAEVERSGGSVGKSLAVIFLMLLLGAAAAFGYFKLSTPKTGASSAPPSASPTSAPAKTTTPAKSLLPGDGSAYVLVRQRAASM
ncbi:MAG: hypothetical protein IVW57_09945 [Ktedonobacterales bacterium]|nr:hypothetical protein [Ktedonobacterales bacterium]